MKEIKLTRGQSALVDDSDFEFLNQWKWTAFKPKNGSFYAVRKIRLDLNKKACVLMHRQILGLSNQKIKVDHKDHNGLNNQKFNIRIATQRQNCFNTSSRKNSTSKYLGVSWVTARKKWIAQIAKGHGAGNFYLGVFKNEDDAARAYNKKAIELFGNFANLNKVA